MRLELLAIICLLGAGCASYDASIKLTIEGGTDLGLSSGGGYSVELRGPNGERIEGLQTSFLSFVEGEQTAGVVVRSFEPEAMIFADGEKASPLILRVEARLQPGGAPIAAGSTRVRVRRHRPVAATVVLHPDPRPLGRGFELHYGTDWAGLQSGDVGAPDSSLAFDRSPAAPEGQTFHAWVCEPECATSPPRWLGEVEPSLDGSATQLLFVDDADPLIARELEFQVTAEDLDLGEGSLGLPLGFVVASGQLQESRRTALAALLTTREESVAGQLETVPADAVRIPEMLQVAAIHSGFAATPGRDDSYVRSHTAHVFWTLFPGSPGSATLPTESPLPDDLDPRGLLGDGNVQGRLERLDLEATAAAEMSTSPEVADAALALSAELAAIRSSVCEAWAWELYILMGSCTAPTPPECGSLDCPAFIAGATDLPSAAIDHQIAAEAAASVTASLPGGQAGDPLFDAIEKMSRFTATAAEAGP